MVKQRTECSLGAGFSGFGVRKQDPTLTATSFGYVTAEYTLGPSDTEPLIPGLTYLPDFLSEEEERQVLAEDNGHNMSPPVCWPKGGTRLKLRDVQITFPATFLRACADHCSPTHKDEHYS